MSNAKHTSLPREVHSRPGVNGATLVEVEIKEQTFDECIANIKQPLELLIAQKPRPDLEADEMLASLRRIVRRDEAERTWVIFDDVLHNDLKAAPLRELLEARIAKAKGGDHK